MNAMTTRVPLQNWPIEPRLSMQPNDQRFKNRFNSLGIPVDNLTRDQAVASIFNLIQDFAKDGIPKLVATLNVDFLVNSLGYRFDKPRHPELFSILRGADLITADGFPIVMLSKIAGFPLKERVTGADLTPELARVAAQRGKSVYLLGGAGNSAERAAELLQRDNPELRIAGTSAPFVWTEGEKLATWEDDDRAIVEDINRSGADILFMAFGNPKQELWFSRNKYRLQVPVSIGIGGTFAFITGEVKRAPKWVQAANLEWVYRMTQDPKRLVKRYAIGMLKFGLLTLPLLAQRAQRLVDRKMSLLFGSDQQQVQMDGFAWQVHWASKDDVLKTLRLPSSVSRTYLEKMVSELQAGAESDTVSHNYMIDFSKVNSLALSANEAFCELARLFKSGRVQGLMIGLSDKLKKRLERARVMDLASSSAVSVAQMQDSIIAKGAKGLDAELKTYMVGETCLNYFSGTVTGEQMANTGFEDCMLDVAQQRRCVIDLRRVTSIDSSAIAILFRLAQAEDRGESNAFRLSGLTPCIRQMISVVGLHSAFKYIDDQAFYDQLFAS